MNPVRAALYGVMTGDDALTDLLSQSEAVFHERAPQNAETPFIIFNRQTGSRVLTFRDHMHWDLWLIKAVDRGPSASMAEAIDERLNGLLENATLDVTGREHLYLRRETDIGYPESDGAETYHYAGGLYRLITDPT